MDPHLSLHDPGAGHTYSDELNGWMLQYLDFDPRLRPGSEKLIETMIPVPRETMLRLGGVAAWIDMDTLF